jgi:polysaccharide export outer membrane protein
LKTTSVLLLFLLFVTSCASKKDILYLQDETFQKNQTITQNYVNILQPDDILLIIVSNSDNIGTQRFNLSTTVSAPGMIDDSIGRQRLVNYVIRKDGSIEFPILGKIQLAGLTISEAVELIRVKLEKYIKEPKVVIEWLNFKYSVSGEVRRPGLFTSVSERVSILDALAMAGDLTIYGNRKNIILIREINGKRSTYNVDLTNVKFMNDETYYIKQNDHIIVSPNNAQIQSSSFNQNVPVYISAASILLSLIIILTRN